MLLVVLGFPAGPGDKSGDAGADGRPQRTEGATGTGATYPKVSCSTWEMNCSSPTPPTLTSCALCLRQNR